MFKGKRLVQLLVLFALAGIIFQGSVYAQARFQQQNDATGLVSIEAENYTDMVLLVATYWEEVTEPEDYSGAGAMETFPAGENRHKDITDAQSFSPYMEYTVNFVKAEPVYVWIRASHIDGYDDSVWFGLDDSIEGTAPLQFTTEEQSYSNVWHWISRMMNTNNDRAVMQIPSAGEHVFKLYMREPSFKADKIVLTTDESYVPDADDGVGPAETLAGGGDFSITIDAEKDAWYDELTGPENGLVFMPARCYLSEIGAGTGPDDDADLSAFVWSAWDDTYLYFYAEVKDDIVTASNTARYENDCLELKFDPNPTEGSGEGSANSRLTALGADLAEQASGVDNLNGSGNLKDMSSNKWEPTEADYARKLLDDGYALEFRIPREYINVVADAREMVWGEGQVFGMAINVGDNDGTSRDNMLQWSAGHTDQAHSYGMYHGSVTFLADHKLNLDASVSPRDESIVNDSAAVWYSNPNSAVDVEPVSVKAFNLVSNYPNPFNPETKIQYQIQRAEPVTLAIYSVTGERIRRLTTDQFHAPGSYEIVWNGKNDMGQIVGSGIYFCKLTTSTFVASNKMMMLK